MLLNINTNTLLISNTMTVVITHYLLFNDIGKKSNRIIFINKMYFVRNYCYS